MGGHSLEDVRQVLTKWRSDDAHMFSCICEGQRNVVDVEVVDGLHVGGVLMTRWWSKDLEFGLLWVHHHHVLAAVSQCEMEKMT